MHLGVALLPPFPLALWLSIALSLFLSPRLLASLPPCVLASLSWFDDTYLEKKMSLAGRVTSSSCRSAPVHE